MTADALTPHVLARVQAGARTAARIVVELRPLDTDVETVRDVLAALHAAGAILRDVRRDHRGRETIVYRPLDEPPAKPRRGPPLKPLADHVRRVLLSLHQSDLDALDAYAARLGTTRSRAVAQRAREAGER